MEKQPPMELNINRQESALSPKKTNNVSYPVTANTVPNTVATKTEMYKPRSQTTRVGRITKVPDRYCSQ